MITLSRRTTPLMVGWASLAILNVLDTWSTRTLLASHQIMAQEANPITVWLINHNLFEATKLIMVMAVGLACLKTKNPMRLTVLVWLIVPIYLFVVVHNISYI